MGTGGTCISVTECIVTTQSHDAHIFKSKRVARHVNFKRKKRTVNLRKMKLDNRNYLDLNENTCFQAFRPCKTQTNLLSYRD